MFFTIYPALGLGPGNTRAPGVADKRKRLSDNTIHACYCHLQGTASSKAVSSGVSRERSMAAHKRVAFNDCPGTPWITA